MRRKILEAAERLTAPQPITWIAHFACGATKEGEAMTENGRATLPNDVCCEHHYRADGQHRLLGFRVGVKVFEREGNTNVFRAIDTVDPLSLS
jgi:hypothetical protein